MIDNFDKILPLLQFPKGEDSFYFVQVLQRKKDHKDAPIGTLGSNNSARLVKAYHINSVEKLLKQKEEMIKLADIFNARIGINLNPRSFEKTAFELLEKIAHQMKNRDFYNIRKAYDSVCGIYQAEMDKRWLVDIDTKEDCMHVSVMTYINKLHDVIKNREYIILTVLETKAGYHIITNPFNLEAFRKEFPSIDVHKNNPTVLYQP